MKIQIKGGKVGWSVKVKHCWVLSTNFSNKKLLIIHPWFLYLSFCFASCEVDGSDVLSELLDNDVSRPLPLDVPAPLLLWPGPKVYIIQVGSRNNGVLESGWYKAPLSYMIYSAYYCPPFVKVGPYSKKSNLTKICDLRTSSMRLIEVLNIQRKGKKPRKAFWLWIKTKVCGFSRVL